MIIVLLAFIGALAITGILAFFRVIASRKKMNFDKSFTMWLIILFVFNFFFDVLYLYFGMPALTGPFGGWEWILWPGVLSAIVSIFLRGVSGAQELYSNILNAGERFRAGNGNVINSRRPRAPALMADGAGAAGIFMFVFILFIAVIVNSGIVVATTWFDGNAKALAALPNVSVMPSGAQLPPTNVQHIVQVTQAIASFKGQQTLGQNGQNLGSLYQVEQSDFVLQSVNQHLYWIAPLVYNNIFVNLSHSSTPGYVVVDAENPNTPAQLKTGYTMRYIPGALLNQDLIRHVYLSGYVNGNLEDPTLEVNDNWQPYFTVSLMTPSHGFTGATISKVLLVDPQSGDVQAYAPQDTPSWVDRVYSQNVVNQYMTWWGLYHYASWFNPSGALQQQPASAPELVYNNIDQPVWIIPMTSSAASDNSSTGIVLYDTRKNSAQYYQLSGLGIGDNVVHTFSSNPHNIRNYDVSGVQLYNIYGKPTWVAIFSQANAQGATFQAIGLLDANELNGSNVQMEPTLNQALTDYQQWLATNAGGSSIASSQGLVENFSGKLLRIAPTTVNNETVYYLWVQGQSNILTAPLSLSPLLPLAQPGDMITGTYLNTGTTVVTLTAFTDNSVQLSPPVGVTPTATPTAGG